MSRLASGWGLQTLRDFARVIRRALAGHEDNFRMAEVYLGTIQTSHNGVCGPRSCGSLLEGIYRHQDLSAETSRPRSHLISKSFGPAGHSAL